MGRTAYHYAAMCNDGGQYYQLVGSYGPDATISDSVSTTNKERSTLVKLPLEGVYIFSQAKIGTFNFL